MQHTGSNHYVAMAGIMIVSGLLSTMNIWADSIDDFGISVNDLYMSILMTGWMVFFMAIYYGDTRVIFVGLIIVIASVAAIRYQLFVSEAQYLRGMIPHHSMAVFMSKRMLEKSVTPALNELLHSIISSQQKEIIFMKEQLQRS